MGVIYGYISLTDKPVDPAIAEAMRKANSFWEPDGDGLFVDEHAAMGSLILFNTPEAVLEKQPIHFDDNRKVMVATARIDNRDDLCRDFGIPLSARDIYPDSYYIRLAYEKWGETCPDHLLGDWSFAVYDKTTHKLFIAREQHGIMACYYYQGADFFVFSSSLKGILCLQQVPKKENEFKIAQILVYVNDGGPETCYLDIFRLPPAHTLTLANKQITTNQYWNLDHVPQIRFKTDQEYIDRFRELYTEAVRCRLRSYRPVGATLSGGLDSGSVCILASQELAKYGKRLPAFTAVPLYEVPWPKNRIGDEGPLALALAKKLGNVDVTLCKSENISPLLGVEISLDVHDQPGFVILNAYWITDILNNCKNSNLGTLLTGQSGNATVSWPTNSLINKNKHILKSTLRFIRTKLYYTLGNWRKDFIVSEKILNNKQIINEIKNTRIITPFITKQKRLKLIKPGKDTSGERWLEKGNYYKIEVRDPTTDIRLINYLMGIPINKQFTNKRVLFNGNFQNYFPENILKAKAKGIQGVDIIEHINSEIYTNSSYNEISEILYSYFNPIKIKKLNINSNNFLIYKTIKKYLNRLLLY
jgi:asparagine synthase (glutamine-hydrolysing)